MIVRNPDVVAYIEEHPGASSKELAEHFSVSTRTVRKYVNACNAAMGGAARIEFDRRGANGAGYYVTVSDRDRYESWRHETSLLLRDAVPETTEERVRFLLNILLMQSGWITRERLAEILYVSPASVTSLIKRVEEILAQFSLSLERRPRYGMRVVGSEISRRVCWASVVVKELDTQPGERRELSVSDHLAYRLTLDRIDRCVSAVLEETGFHISKFSYENLLVHIGVALLRIQEGCYVPMALEQAAQSQYASEYPVAERIARSLERDFDVAVPEEEVAYIAIHLAGKQIVTFDPDAEAAGNVISDDVWNVTSQILEHIWDAFRIDLRGDVELRMNLAQHIMPLSVRLHYHLTAANPMIAEIKTRYPFAYAMALEASAVLGERYDTEVSDDETGYIALSLALALERQKSGLPKKNILVVCASGHGSARLLEYRCRQEFGDCINRIETCDAQHVSRVDFSDIDYVFTTVPLSAKLPVPVREVKFFLDDTNVSLIRDLLQRSEARGGILHYFDPELFMAHVRAADKDEVLVRMCDLAAAHREVDRDFRSLVMEREAAAPTAFGGLVAIPHPSRAACDSSFVCVCLLDAPVEWNGNEVRAVFLLSIARQPDADLEAFYDRLSDVIFDSQSIRRLLSDQRFQTLESIFAGEAGGKEGEGG